MNPAAASNQYSSSLDRYLQRNPCILQTLQDKASSNPLILQFIIYSLILSTTFITYQQAIYHLQWHHITGYFLETAVLVLLFLYTVLSHRSPGYSIHSENMQEVSNYLTQHNLLTDDSYQELSRAWSYCNDCKGYRPARSHHCRTCNRCVLLMEHHCLWLNNCIGANNVYHFIGFITLLFALSLFAFIINIRVAYYVISNSNTVGDFSLLQFLLQFLLSSVGLFAGFYLLFRQLYYILNNTTTVELLKRESYINPQNSPPLKLSLPLNDSLTPSNNLNKAVSDIDTTSCEDEVVTLLSRNNPNNNTNLTHFNLSAQPNYVDYFSYSGSSVVENCQNYLKDVSVAVEYLQDE
jgi:hypothetical protein